MDSTVKIYRPTDIIFEQILIKKRISIGPSVYEYPISYMTRQCIVQTPIVFIPYSTYKVNNKITFDFFFLNMEIDKSMCELRHFVEELDTIVLKKIRSDIKQYKESTKPKRGRPTKKAKVDVVLEHFRPKEFISNIKQNSICFGGKAKKMRINCYDNILAFDSNKNPLSLEYLKGKSYIKMLLSPTKIWVNKEKYGIFWEALQVKMYPKTVINNYMFIDDYNETHINTNINTNTNIDNINRSRNTPLDMASTNTSIMAGHPKYKKYVDMVKKGVPKQAVKQKMILDGVDPNLLDNTASNSLSTVHYSLNSSTSHPPPPLSLATMLVSRTHMKNNIAMNTHTKISNSEKMKLNSIHGGDTSSLLSELRLKTSNGNNGLKSTSFPKLPKNESSNKIVGVNSFTPTLDDIITCRRILKKIDSESNV